MGGVIAEGGELLQEIGGVLAAVVLAVVLVFVVLSARRWLFERKGGTVECSLRRLPAGGEPGVWRLGIGRYKGDELHWHRVFGFRSRPRQVIHRRGLVVCNRRSPEADEAALVSPDVSIIELRDGDLNVELAMSPAALTGFLAWMEAAPPGFPVEPG
ncbi:DUF2550 domain-containing protein [Actinomadura craniellae]|uniref:DUF2550 domain-containing protein n=1 Tax=Actinomadura craniellae TaxID=2231787 RepID=A0A365H9J1_9ACTN|nr:DUF2550 domain-containing protein [Actinomadura craniellae]RAY15765.1 DUF2550 domain-containing protein [Actinomadura craniellae]